LSSLIYTITQRKRDKNIIKRTNIIVHLSLFSLRASPARSRLGAYFSIVADARSFILILEIDRISSLELLRISTKEFLKNYKQDKIKYGISLDAVSAPKDKVLFLTQLFGYIICIAIDDRNKITTTSKTKYINIIVYSILYKRISCLVW